MRCLVLPDKLQKYANRSASLPCWDRAHDYRYEQLTWWPLGEWAIHGSSYLLLHWPKWNVHSDTALVWSGSYKDHPDWRKGACQKDNISRRRKWANRLLADRAILFCRPHQPYRNLLNKAMLLINLFHYHRWQIMLAVIFNVFSLYLLYALDARGTWRNWYA